MLRSMRTFCSFIEHSILSQKIYKERIVITRKTSHKSLNGDETFPKIERNAMDGINLNKLEEYN